MKRYMYIPLDDFSCRAWAQGLQSRDFYQKDRERRTLLSGANCLDGVDDGDTLHILTHGRVKTPDKIGPVETPTAADQLPAGWP